MESACDRSLAIEFQLAYQARVAMDRIRYAITVIENRDTRREELRDVGLQLLDAFNRLSMAERVFQRRSICSNATDDNWVASPRANGSRDDG